MKLSIESLKSIFDTIINNECISRKELASTLMISNVSIGHASDILASAGLINISKDNSKKDAGGRRAELLLPSKDKLCLLINACDGFVSFSLSPLARKPSAATSLPFIYTLDFNDNFAVALSSIKETLAESYIKPSIIAVAFPGEVSLITGRLEGTRVRDYLGGSVIEIMDRYGMTPDIIMSGASAAARFCNKQCIGAKRLMYISISEQIWGCVNGEYYEDWGDIAVDRSLALSYSEALRCCCDEEALTIYTGRFINTLRSAFSTDEIYVSSTVLSGEILKSLDLKVHDALEVSPVLYGLFDATKDKLFDKLLKATQP